MTWLDKLDETVAGMTPSPWRYAHLMDGLNARALLDGNGYHFAQVDDTQNGEAVVKKKDTPRPKPKKNLLKVRGITTTDTEWAWVCKQAGKLDVSASALVRRLIQQAMEENP